jgi:hypothetical protein
MAAVRHPKLSVYASRWSQNVACSGLAAMCMTVPQSAVLAPERADIRSQHLTFRCSAPYLPQHRRRLVHRVRSLPMSAIYCMSPLPTSAIHRLPGMQIAIGLLVQSV